MKVWQKGLFSIYIMSISFGEASPYVGGNMGGVFGNGYMHGQYSYSPGVNDRRGIASQSLLGGIAGGYQEQIGNLVFGIEGQWNWMRLKERNQERPIGLVNHIFQLRHSYNFACLLQLGWNLGGLIPYLQFGALRGYFKAYSDNLEETNGPRSIARHRWGIRGALGITYRLQTDGPWSCGAAVGLNRYASLTLHSPTMFADYRISPRVITAVLSLQYTF